MNIEENRQWVMATPRAIIGVSLLFWGVMVEHELIGLALALFSEGYCFLKTRWVFTYSNYVRAWYLSVLVALLITFVYWVDGATRSELREVLEWLPLIFFPLLFVQRYGQRDSMPINTFSLIARKRMSRDMAEGRLIQPYMLNTTIPYFLIVLLAAGLNRRSANFYDVFSIDIMQFYCYGIAILLGGFIFLIGKKNGRGVFQFMIPYGLMMFMAVFLLAQLNKVEARFGSGIQGDSGMDLEQTFTNIGQLGKIKNTKRVQWRMWVPEKEQVPERVPFTVFNSYHFGRWFMQYPMMQLNKTRFSSAAVVDSDEGRIQSFAKNINDARFTREINAYRFVSTLVGNVSTSVVPHLPGYYAYGGLVSNETSAERSVLGSVRFGNPDATLNCYIWADGLDRGRVSLPETNFDDAIPIEERDAILKVVDELGLREMEPVDKVSVLHQYFLRNFSYTTHLTNEGDVNKSLDEELETPLSRFLSSTKAGHCEYFATAAALILREAGLMTRYINGFAVNKSVKVEDAYALRGDQAHAWCKVWIDGKWVDVDVTPPDWMGIDSKGESSFTDKMVDWWKMLKEDFQVWRSIPENAGFITKIVAVLIGIVTLWIFLRLYFSKSKMKRDVTLISELPSWKIMKKFDRWCVKKLGRRKTGVAYGEWIERLTPLVIEEKKADVFLFSNLYSKIRFSDNSEDSQSVDELTVIAKRIMEKK